MPPNHNLMGLLATAISPGSSHDLHGDRVPDPVKVFYGITPWVPAKDVTYTSQEESGAWNSPVPGVTRTLCDHCLDDPKAAGLEMCPGCHRFASETAEAKLQNQRRRASLFAGAGVPLTPPEPPGKTPDAVLEAKWDDVTESKSRPQAKQDRQTKASRAERRRARARSKHS